MAAAGFLSGLLPPFNLNEEETRFISHSDLTAILVRLVADRGKASRYSKLKIITKFCYEEHVPSRYVKEMSVQFLPVASP